MLKFRIPLYLRSRFSFLYFTLVTNHAEINLAMVVSCVEILP